MTYGFSWAKCNYIAELVGDYCDAELVREYIQDEFRDGNGGWILSATLQEIADWVAAGIQSSVDQREEDNSIFMKGQGF